MYILSAKEMARIEKLAIDGGASDREFMLNAAAGISQIVLDFLHEHKINQVTLLAGKGNNGGDGYVVAKSLLENHIKVHALQIGSLEECSPLCQEYQKEFIKTGGKVELVENVSDKILSKDGIVLDAILGTGFKGKLEGDLLKLVDLVNLFRLPVISIDIPSGLNGSTGVVENSAIYADLTIFLGMPKTGFFIERGWNHVGEIIGVHFGLDEKYIEGADVDLELITHELARALLPPIKRTQHKYEAGYVVGLSGSLGMSGAAILSGLSALRSGAGIVRLMHPKGMETAFSMHVPELVKQSYSYKEIDPVYQEMKRASSVFIGPGLGKEKPVKEMLKQLLEMIDSPLVLDADCLNIIAEDNLQIPEHAILTPHEGEFARLVDRDLKKIAAQDKLLLAQEFVDTHNVILVLKGAPTFIFHPMGIPYVNITCDPGMATAGSGDVLTGVISAFLAKDPNPLAAAILGVYIHGLAGSYASEQKTSYSLVARDIIDSLPIAFAQLIGE